MKKDRSANAISDETKQQAMAVAKANQKPGQTKEQTKLIAAGIEKGIAEYKKQQKAKARTRDKQRKAQIKAKQNQQAAELEPVEFEQPIYTSQFTPLAKALAVLLVVSWGVIAAL
ncbi:DUF2956 domain-containing protein [Shewanella maritima]|uniref:DUF2956 domain-containing protein n=1 Tax=Shewanella maritima TaxID=2520507 RepID=A0A411PI55_9GAMM|nr:DUF2956 domain-containing protein [Shewanella maritima]QBF83291.1 DUF2956 domain-containing protein [Shewanella maritima]